MITKATRHPATALVDTVVALYDQLIVVTAEFLDTLQEGAPDETAQIQFIKARTELIVQLKPLLAREEQWRLPGSGGQLDLTNQLQKMEQVNALDAQISSRLTILQAQIDAELKSLSQAKKGLGGYRVGLKVSPRFCQITA